MERWEGRVAVVTGASSGIGAAILKALVKSNVKVVGLARRKHLIEEIPNKTYALECDVTQEESIKQAFAWVEEHLGGCHILINNAGVAHKKPFLDTETSSWRAQWEVNVLGLSICTREAIALMRRRGTDDGHIINISSVAGHQLVSNEMAMYSASKYSVQVLTEAVRRELRDAASHIKVTTICPGMVRTDIFRLPAMNLSKEEVKELYEERPLLETEDVANACLYILGTPPRVQVHDLVIKPLGELF